MHSDKQQPSPSQDQLIGMVENLAFIAEQMAILAFSKHALVQVLTFDNDRLPGFEQALRWRDPDYRWAFPVFQFQRGELDASITSMATRFADSFADAGLRPRPALLAAWLLSPKGGEDGIRHVQRGDRRAVEDEAGRWTRSLLHALRASSTLRDAHD